MTYYKKQLGNRGEEEAVKYLQKNGYKIIQQNYRCRTGEIDIIANDGNYLVFIEVKSRKNTDYGAPGEAVNYFKQQKIIKVAQFYLMTKSIEPNVRFDVVEIIGEIKNQEFNVGSIKVIKNAF